MPIIKSKYAGRCYSCGDKYEIGDDIYWNKGDAPICVGCHEEDTANAASPVKPVQQGVTARFNPELPMLRKMVEKIDEFLTRFSHEDIVDDYDLLAFQKLADEGRELIKRAEAAQ